MEAGAAGGAGGAFSPRNKVVWDGPVMPSPIFCAGGAFRLEIMHFAGAPEALFRAKITSFGKGRE